MPSHAYATVAAAAMASTLPPNRASRCRISPPGDFVSDNVDHGPHKFVGGAHVGEVMSHGRPIEFHPTPPGTPAWGSGWKHAVARYYNHAIALNIHGSSVAAREN